MKKLFILVAIFTAVAGMAQSVGINADGSAANATAILDLKSTTKGFLPPRMTTTERNAIGTPATGLVIFNTTTNGLEFKSSTGWTSLTTDNVTFNSLTLNGTLTVGGSSLSFASYTSAATTTISSGNHIVSGALITLELETTPTPPQGTFCVIYNTLNGYTLSQNITSTYISANNTTVCIYNGAGWVAYSNGVLKTFA
jgi:trimeric autotransporter adhesin